MQLKGTLLQHLPIVTNNRDILSQIPNHNNNQPFRHVNLGVGEVQVGSGQNDERVAVYSLCTNNGGGVGRGVREHGGVGGVGNLVGVGQNGGGGVAGNLGGSNMAMIGGGNGFNTGYQQQEADVKFVTNEYGFLEILDETPQGMDDFDDDDDEDSEDDEESWGSEGSGEGGEDGEEDGVGGREVVTCITCGCFGLMKEFVDENHCTNACQTITRVNERKKEMGKNGDGKVSVEREEQESIEEEEEEEEEQVEKESEDIETTKDDTNECEDSADDEEENDDDDCENSDRKGVNEKRKGLSEVAEHRMEGGYKRKKVTNDEDRTKKRRKKSGDGCGVRGTRMRRKSGVKIISNPFRVNDLLEAIDPEHQSLFCPVQVTEIVGFRLLLKFIGYPDKYWFWVNADSEDIFPVEWAASYKSPHAPHHPLHFHCPPNFTWSSYKSTSPLYRFAPSSNFPHIKKIQSCSDTEMRVGMKIEAVDVRSRSLPICVATVSCVMGERFLVHFDSWDSLYDYWTTVDGGCVFPVGYCRGGGDDEDEDDENIKDKPGMGRIIMPPHCYETPSEFEWTEYLRKTGAVAMPADLFPDGLDCSSVIPWKVGDEVEAIDRRSPRLLRKAVVCEVTSHTVTLHFGGLGRAYDYEVPVIIALKDIHEVGWGEKVGHPVVDEEDDDGDIVTASGRMRRRGRGKCGMIGDNDDFVLCVNDKICRSVGSTDGGNCAFHYKLRNCPYWEGKLSFWISHGFTDRVVVYEDKLYDLGGGGDGSGEEEADEELDENELCEEQSDEVDVEEEEDGGEGDDDNNEQMRNSSTNSSSSNSSSNSEGDSDKEQFADEILNGLVQVVEGTEHRDSCSSPPSGGDDDDEKGQNNRGEENPINIASSSLSLAYSISSVNQGGRDRGMRMAQQQQPQAVINEQQQIPKRAEILTWSHEQVSELVQNLCSNLPTSEIVAERFRNNLIDGESFMMLTQGDMTEALGIKLGPAVKIFNLIRLIGLNK